MRGTIKEGARGGEKVKMNNRMLLILPLDINVHLAYLKFSNISISNVHLKILSNNYHELG